MVSYVYKSRGRATRPRLFNFAWLYPEPWALSVAHGSFLSRLKEKPRNQVFWLKDVTIYTTENRKSDTSSIQVGEKPGFF
jgi:hypothetical protein